MSADYLPSCMWMMWFCMASQENMKVMVAHFVEMCGRRGLYLNTDKSKVMVLGEEEGLLHEVLVDWM